MPRGYGWRTFKASGFPGEEYSYPTESGAFAGELVMKRWGAKGSLVCYFDTDDGNKFTLCVWKGYDDSLSYRPENSDLDISELDLGCRMWVDYIVMENGWCRMMDALVLPQEDSED